jgi:CDP-diglyceride synthetase
MKRVLTAGLLIPPVIYIIFAAHPVLFLVVQAAVALVCYHEYRRLAGAHGL